jgi:hypothetical protein
MTGSDRDYGAQSGLIYKTRVPPIDEEPSVAPASPNEPDAIAALSDVFPREQAYAIGEALGSLAEIIGSESGIVERRLTDRILQTENRQLRSENAELRRQLEERAERDDVVDFDAARRAIRTRDVA